MSKSNNEKNPMLDLINNNAEVVQPDNATTPVEDNKTQQEKEKSPELLKHPASDERTEDSGKKHLDARFNSIWNKAWKGQQQPEDLSFGERSCFLYAVLLSKMYYAKLLTMEEGMEHKEYLRNFFMYYHEQEEAMLKCGTALKLLSDSADPNVQKVVREVRQIFTDDRLPWCG